MTPEFLGESHKYTQEFFHCIRRKEWHGPSILCSETWSEDQIFVWTLLRASRNLDVQVATSTCRLCESLLSNFNQNKTIHCFDYISIGTPENCCLIRPSIILWITKMLSYFYSQFFSDSWILQQRFYWLKLCSSFHCLLIWFHHQCWHLAKYIADKCQVHKHEDNANDYLQVVLWDNIAY